MTIQTRAATTPDANSALWPFIALAVLGVSIALMYVNDNTFLVVPPVLVTVISALRVRGNKWYLLPLIPGALGVLYMVFVIVSFSLGTAS